MPADLHIGMDTEKVVVSAYPIRTRTGRARRNRTGTVTECLPVPPSGRSREMRVTFLARLGLPLFFLSAALYAAGVPWLLLAAGTAATLALVGRRDARRAQRATFEVPRDAGGPGAAHRRGARGLRPGGRRLAPGPAHLAGAGRHGRSGARRPLAHQRPRRPGHVAGPAAGDPPASRRPPGRTPGSRPRGQPGRARPRRPSGSRPSSSGWPPPSRPTASCAASTRPPWPARPSCTSGRSARPRARPSGRWPG